MMLGLLQTDGRRIWIKKHLAWNTVFGVTLNYTHPDGLKEGGTARQVRHTSSSQRLWNSKKKPPLFSLQELLLTFFICNFTRFLWWLSEPLLGLQADFVPFFKPSTGVYHSKQTCNTSPVNLEQSSSRLTKESLLFAWGLERRCPLSEEQFLWKKENKRRPMLPSGS